MRTNELKSVLERLEVVLAEAGARTAASDVRDLVELLDGYGDRPIDDFFEVLRSQAKPPKQREKIASTATDDRVVEQHVQALNDAALDRTAFEASLRALKDDSRAGKVEVDKIAHSFIGGRASWPTRKAALDAILTRFNERAFQASKMKHLEKFRPW